jgi:ribosomal protein S12 methylthiotransferase accessory factor
MEMIIDFPHGQKVTAKFLGFQVTTDQPVESGGENTAPDPFSLFLSSIGTYTGIYVLRFCQERHLPTEDLNLVLKTQWNEKKRLISTIDIMINTGNTFPDKYKNTLIKVANLCTVKRHLEKPPFINITIN